jgi:hypothetical protein
MLNLQIVTQQALEEATLPAVIGLVLFAVDSQLMVPISSVQFHLLPSSQSLLQALRESLEPSVELPEIQHTWQCQTEWKLRDCMRLDSESAVIFVLGISKHSPEHCLHSSFGRAVSRTTAFQVARVSFPVYPAILVEIGRVFGFFALQRSSSEPASHILVSSERSAFGHLSVPRYIASSQDIRGV